MAFNNWKQLQIEAKNYEGNKIMKAFFLLILINGQSAYLF